MITLVDLGGVFWRCWYATRSDVDAYSLTVETLQDVHENAERAAVCCDAPPLLRKQRFPDYKANRDEKPREALDALRSVEQQADGWGMPIVRVVGYEADDLIGTLTRQAVTSGESVRIVSHDKDFMCLVCDSVVMVKKDGSIIDERGVVAKFGVLPTQMVDFLTLVGDTADNVPGCPSVGPGRARDLLQRFGTLDGILRATDEELDAVRGVGETTITSLRSWDPSLARELVTLVTDVPVSLDEVFKVTTTQELPAISW